MINNKISNRLVAKFESASHLFRYPPFRSSFLTDMVMKFACQQLINVDLLIISSNSAIRSRFVGCSIRCYCD